MDAVGIPGAASSPYRRPARTTSARATRAGEDRSRRHLDRGRLRARLLASRRLVQDADRRACHCRAGARAPCPADREAGRRAAMDSVAGPRNSATTIGADGWACLLRQDGGLGFFRPRRYVLVTLSRARRRTHRRCADRARPQGVESAADAGLSRSRPISPATGAASLSPAPTRRPPSPAIPRARARPPAACCGW